MRKYLVMLILLCMLFTVRAALADAPCCVGESVWIDAATVVIEDPAQDQQVVGSLPAGATVTVLGAQGEWIAIESETAEPVRGYVRPDVLRYDRVKARNEIPVSLEPGYEIVAGAWLYGLPESAFLLLGNESENDMRLAVITRSEDGTYRVIARSERILTYDKYRAGDVEMLDHWNDGSAYFWYMVGHSEEIYMTISDLGENDWRVTSGYATDEEADVHYSYDYDPSAYADGIILYDCQYPKICWPVEGTMSLEGFRWEAFSEECVAAMGYLRKFSESCREGEQDGTYRILW